MGLEERYDPGEGFCSQSAKQVSLPLSDLLLIAILPTSWNLPQSLEPVIS